MFVCNIASNYVEFFSQFLKINKVVFAVLTKIEKIKTPRLELLVLLQYCRKNVNNVE